MKGLDSIVALGIIIIPDIHFSTLHLADQLNLFSKHGVAVKVTEFAGSSTTTGELARMLKDKKVEILEIGLTDGPISSIASGAGAKITSTSPFSFSRLPRTMPSTLHVPLRTQRLPSTLPLSSKWPLLRMTSPTNLSKQESVLEDCDGAHTLALNYLHYPHDSGVKLPHWPGSASRCTNK